MRWARVWPAFRSFARDLSVRPLCHCATVVLRREQGRVAGHIKPSYPVPRREELDRVVVSQSFTVCRGAVAAYRRVCGLGPEVLHADAVPILFPAVRMPHAHVHMHKRIRVS